MAPREWSIGILAGDSPLRLRPLPGVPNPVLSRGDVSDVAAGFVADPFLLRQGETWYLFFEVLNGATGCGEIGVAESTDARRWRYRGIVLREPCHLSYPCVFAWKGRHYLVPESLELGAVRLYRAAAFPAGWSPVATLVQGAMADPTPFRHGGRWWMFVCPRPDHHDALRLYHASRLHGPWCEHPRSPLLLGNRRAARPAGRVTSWNGRLLRFAQDCFPVYGSAVRAFEITRLTPEDYAEREVEMSPALAPGPEGEWNATGMHHVAPHRLPGGGWIASVDARS
jgi:hypothetical protein